jgi:Cu/Ag efflux protein CusF
MRMWKVALLLNLALLLGIGGGYLWWGRRAGQLEQDLTRSPGGPTALGQELTVRGVVRAVLPEAAVIVITHEEVPGVMAPMTMGFRLASAEISNGVQIGDAVRFTLRVTGAGLVVTALERGPEEGRR